MSFFTTCSALDIRLANFLSRPGVDSNLCLKAPIYCLRRLNHIWNKYKSCPLCRLVFAVFRSGPLKEISGISELESVAVFAKWINALGPSKAERSRSASTCILLWAESASIPSRRYKVVIRAVCSLLPDQPHFGRLSSMRSSLLDFAQIKCWLGHCENQHVECATISEAKPSKHFFVIDFLDKCIVEPQGRCCYIALSYVWGGVDQYMLTEDNLEELQLRGGIKEKHLAKTLQDAMALTEKLGLRYL